MNFKNILLGCLLGLPAIHVAAQDIPKDLYVASSIPEALKVNANSVERYEMDETTILGPGHINNKAHTIITILNEKGERYAYSLMFYDKETSIKAYNMNVFDAEGKLIKKYRKSDMYDRSGDDGMSLVTDTRVKMIGHNVARYPITIEVEYEVEHTSSLGSDSWGLQAPEQSVQNAYCRYIVAPSAGFHYRLRNTSIEPDKQQVKGNDVYTWQVHNLAVDKEEEGVPAWRVMPRIDFTTDNFEYTGIEGSMSTWQNFGKWIAGLNQDVNTLPPAKAEKFRQMTASLKTDKEKARFLYEYLQKNMRYVSIQLGIGGFKPFAASFVDDKKYGDCKALSNYMHAMLKAVNIPSYYAIIRAGDNEEPADPGFSVNRFNHAVICIPFKNDTTWLECTSNTQPFGVLGSFTENRNALLITENGGKLVNTPKSKASENTFSAKSNIKLGADGSAITTIETENTGQYRSTMLGIARNSTDEQKAALINILHMKQPYVFNITDLGDAGGVKKVKMELEYDKFCDIKAGNKQFYRPAAFLLWGYTLEPAEKRKNDYYFDQPVQKNAVTTIELPAGFEIESLPAAQKLSFSYGSYEVNYAYDTAKNVVTVTSSFVLNEHVIPAAKYTEMQKYMHNVEQAQNKRMVIRAKA